MNHTTAEHNAFPTQPSVVPDDQAAGMTMREWYAGMAMQGLVATGGRELAAIAADAFNIADAMLKQAAS